MYEVIEGKTVVENAECTVYGIRYNDRAGLYD